jgi:(1->4)-alpha-D-glucan 1-alpha-D-glucosylmutase
VQVQSTYRLQLHRDFGFADAEALVPYCARLGVSHLYLSPITTARPGSTHGYDVVDPAAINPELGGREGFERLVATLRAHGMGAIIDIVPNHMAVPDAENRWFHDVLRHGRSSPYARYFDIDWDAGPMVLPFLGEPLAEDAVPELADDAEGRPVLVIPHGPQVPVRPEDEQRVRDLAASSARPEAWRDLLADQHYRLVWHRLGHDLLNWRRFFAISGLAGIRIEDPEVFEATHALYFDLYRTGLIDGVRVDHVDGLADPTSYCRLLRERLDALVAERPEEAEASAPYIVVEKILASGERLPADWLLDGTSGYDAMEDLSALMHDPAGAEPLDRLWQEISGDQRSFATIEREARSQMLDWEFSAQREAAIAAMADLLATDPDGRHFTRAMIRRAFDALLAIWPLYRTYEPDSAARLMDGIEVHIREAVIPLTPPGEMMVIDAILGFVFGHRTGNDDLVLPALRRFAQLSAPIAAKGVEDTAFYRYGRLISRNDVGGRPDLLGLDAGAFHRRVSQRAAGFPRTMLTTATHDHKRGADLRMRLAVIAEVPDAWAGLVARWQDWLGKTLVHPSDSYQMLQTLVGLWPADGRLDKPLRQRLGGWLEKALREGKVCTSWAEPDPGYEAAAMAVLDRLCARDGELISGAITGFVGAIRDRAEAKSLVQQALLLTLPGVPDCYQGTEFADFSLVDPDNRRPVDFAARQAHFDDKPASGLDGLKASLINDLLTMRRNDPTLFLEGDYRPLPVGGVRADAVLAFERRLAGRGLRVVVAIRHVERWGNTEVRVGGKPVPLGSLLGEAPYAVMPI